MLNALFSYQKTFVCNGGERKRDALRDYTLVDKYHFSFVIPAKNNITRNFVFFVKKVY